MTFEDWIYTFLQPTAMLFAPRSNSIEMGQEMAFIKLNYVPPKLRSITYFSNFRPCILFGSKMTLKMFLAHIASANAATTTELGSHMYKVDG